MAKPSTRKRATKRISPSDPLAKLAHRALRREQCRFESLFPHKEKAPNPTQVHDLRVSIRRLRVALRMFRSVLPRGHKGLRAELKWLGARLGQVRDLDVHHEILKRHRVNGRLNPSALRALGQDNEKELAKARSRLIHALATHRVDRLRKRLARLVDDDFLGRVPKAGRSLSISDRIPDEVRSGLIRVYRLGSAIDANSTPQALHRVRIRTKQLRYQLELCADVFPEIDSLIEKTKRLQEVLGLHQDAWVATTRLRADAAELALNNKGALNPRLYAALISAQEREAAKQRARFRAEWKRLGKTFTRIHLS